MDAEETVALFAKLTEEEVNEELNDEHTYKYFSDEQWTIDDNPIVLQQVKRRNRLLSHSQNLHAQMFHRYMCLDYICVHLRKKRK